MEDDWNIKQVVGLVLMLFSGLVGLVALIVLLCTFLRGEVVGGILLVLTMITGIYLWKRGAYDSLVSGYVIELDSNLRHWTNLSEGGDNINVFATEKQAKSALAMAQISQIMANDERFGGPVTDEEWKDTTLKFVINRVRNTINKAAFGDSYEFLSFHTQEQRDLFLEENEDLVKDYLMIPD